MTATTDETPELPGFCGCEKHDGFQGCMSGTRELIDRLRTERDILRKDSDRMREVLRRVRIPSGL